MEVLGIIPARGGSKGIKHKNIHLVAGRPLIAYTIEAAQRSMQLSRFLCSTDDEDIATVAKAAGCAVVRRPSELAADDTPMKEVVKQLLQSLRIEDYQPDVLVLLQPTAPLRTAKHVDDAIEMLLQSDADSVVSVTAVPAHYHPDWQLTLDTEKALCLHNGQPLGSIVTRRQDLPATYTRNGAIYACWVKSFFGEGSLYGKRCLGFAISAEDSVNIDTEEDLRLAELRLMTRKNRI